MVQVENCKINNSRFRILNLDFRVWGWFIAEARELEHHWPHALTVKYRESQHESSKNFVPTFWGSL